MFVDKLLLNSARYSNGDILSKARPVYVGL